MSALQQTSLTIVVDFEVAIFLTETSTRHSLLTKHKSFRDTTAKNLASNSSKLTGQTNDTAIDIEDVPIIAQEETEEDSLNIANLPAADEDSLFVDDDGPRRSKRSRASTNIDLPEDSSTESGPLAKRLKATNGDDIEEEDDDKKKMAMETSYEGFAIYGRVLCLVVKRRDKKGKGNAPIGGGQAMMEDWITSTQMPPPDD